MPPDTASRDDPGLRAALSRGLEDRPDPETVGLAECLAAAFGPTTVAVIHYGSYAQGADPGARSARDFFVILDRYGDGYRRLAAALGTRFPSRIATLLNRILPPNVLAIPASAGSVTIPTKCAILSLRDLVRACSGRARDHFVLGRLFQQVHLTWTRDPAARASVVAALERARARTFDWGRAGLPARFDVETYCRTLLETSYAAEIRPEGVERAQVLVRAQRETLLAIYGPLLDHLVRTGTLVREGNGYREPGPAGWLDRLRWRTYFGVSKLRATLRWIKYVALYDGWLDYVVYKLERRSGVSMRLTPLERRWPLVFLWPRAVRFLLTRPQRRR